MTKEERIKKWFSNIPDAELISMEIKMEICKKVAKKMMIIIFGLLALELVLLLMLGGGNILSRTADFLNNISKGGSHTKNHYQGVAFAGTLVCLPVLIIPLIVASIYKNKFLKSEATKIVRSMKNDDTKEPHLKTLSEKNVEDILHFDNLNFKLAIIQVLMYDLKLLNSEFDIYDFADRYKEEIDTDSDIIIEPAMSFFKELEIPKKFAPYVETIYMDGGNDVYMNIIPQWDGEDETFDLNEITLTELQQFPNLKKATVMSSNLDEVKEIFDAANIEVKLL